jgi:hypothetical protein
LGKARFVFGEGAVRRAAAEFIVHYHHERNHQGLNNKLFCPDPKSFSEGSEVKRRERPVFCARRAGLGSGSDRAKTDM